MLLYGGETADSLCKVEVDGAEVTLTIAEVGAVAMTAYNAVELAALLCMAANAAWRAKERLEEQMP